MYNSYTWQKFCHHLFMLLLLQAHLNVFLSQKMLDIHTYKQGLYNEIETLANIVLEVSSWFEIWDFKDTLEETFFWRHSLNFSLFLTQSHHIYSEDMKYIKGVVLYELYTMYAFITWKKAAWVFCKRSPFMFHRRKWSDMIWWRILWW